MKVTASSALLLALLVSAPLPAQAQKKGSEIVAITDKDVDQMIRFWTTTANVIKGDPALQKRLAERQRRAEEQEAKGGDSGPERGEDKLKQVFLQEPKLKKVLTDVGIKLERLGPVMTTFFMAQGMVAMKRAGQLKEYPPEIKQAAQVVEKRYADVEKAGAAMKEMEKLTGGGDE